jgi:hypothetical protein
MKPYPYLLDASGAVVVIDSDIVVTAPLGDVVGKAVEGKIVACPGGRRKRAAAYPRVPTPTQPPRCHGFGLSGETRLMGGLLFADDFGLQVDPHDVPLWVRPTARGRAALASLGAINTVVDSSSRCFPQARDRLCTMRRARFSTRQTSSLRAGG